MQREIRVWAIAILSILTITAPAIALYAIEEQRISMMEEVIANDDLHSHVGEYWNGLPDGDIIPDNDLTNLKKNWGYPSYTNETYWDTIIWDYDLEVLWLQDALTTLSNQTNIVMPDNTNTSNYSAYLNYIDVDIAEMAKYDGLLLNISLSLDKVLVRLEIYTDYYAGVWGFYFSRATYGCASIRIDNHTALLPISSSMKQNFLAFSAQPNATAWLSIELIDIGPQDYYDWELSGISLDREFAIQPDVEWGLVLLSVVILSSVSLIYTTGLINPRRK